MRIRLLLLLVLFTFRVCAQEDNRTSVVMKQILERLDSLEKENKQLVEDVRVLRQELETSRSSAPAVPAEGSKPTESSLADRVAVEEGRTAEQAQTKVEAAHKLPIQLNGLLLFNAFANSRQSIEEEPGVYALLTGPNRAGATVRQTLLGLTVEGPRLPGDGRINGFLTMDFYSRASDPEYTTLQLRRAGISLDWESRSFFVGQDKALISPYQPDSLAEVGIPPLAGAGNLWLWLPQARYEERLHFGTNTGLKAQLSLLQTEETYGTVPASVSRTLEEARPAIEGRFAFWHKFDDTRRIEIAPGFHASTTHVAGNSVGSHIGSLDWLVVPASYLKLTGTFFKGQNLANLGALGNGFVITPAGLARPVNSSGGWAQVAFPITNRLTLNLYSGLENDHSPYLSASNIVHDWTYATNLIYRIGPNVLVSAEALQMRTRSFAGVEGLQNHYDLAIGYLF